MRVLKILLILVLLVSCKGHKIPDFSSANLLQLNGEKFTFSQADKSKIRVFIFMSPECPLCISYTKGLLELRNKFQQSNVIFIAVFPGSYYSVTQITSFIEKYNFNFLSLTDPENKFSQIMGATVTPQIILLNKTGEIVYEGAIDDWAYAPGKKKQVVTRKYLEDAIISVLNNRDPETLKTDPIGCYIE